MSEIDKNIESLIVRSLDGELSEDEQLRLNRELIRNPQAQQMLVDYRHVDKLATDALGEVFQGDPVSFGPASPAQSSSPRRWLTPTRTWWLAPGAVAAALLAVFVGRFELARTARAPLEDRQAMVLDEPESGIAARSHEVASAVRAPVGGAVGFMRSVGTAPAVRRNTGREVIGVLGQDGNVYLLEVDRTRTLRQFSKPTGSREDRDIM